MTTTAAERSHSADPTDRFAGAVRAHLARDGKSISKLANEMGVGQVWLSRRLGARRSVDITVDEAAAVADAIGVPLVELLQPHP